MSKTRTKPAPADDPPTGPTGRRASSRLSNLRGQDLDDAIAAGADDEPAVLAPYDAAHALATHDAVAGEFLRTYAFLEVPEPDTGVVACRDSLAAIFAE